METLVNIDIFLFKLINDSGFESIDNIMILLSNKIIFIPLYLFLLYKLYNFNPKKFFWILLSIAVLIFLADFGSVHLFKNMIQRLRPRHLLNLNEIRLIGDCGGQYGFISSHAANMFSISFFISLILKDLKLFISLFTLASLIGFSRIYLGVHFPLDILGGMFWGILVSIISYKILKIKLNATV